MTWPVPPSPTAITCGHPGNPAHGLTRGTEFNLNDVVNFTCSSGYVLRGAARAQCRSSGQWSSPVPTCQGRWPGPRPTHAHTRLSAAAGPGLRRRSSDKPGLSALGTARPGARGPLVTPHVFGILAFELLDRRVYLRSFYCFSISFLKFVSLNIVT